MPLSVGYSAAYNESSKQQTKERTSASESKRQGGAQCKCKKENKVREHHRIQVRRRFSNTNKSQQTSRMRRMDRVVLA